MRITFSREVCILVDPVNSSAASKSYVAIVVCHETAHQVRTDETGMALD